METRLDPPENQSGRANRAMKTHSIKVIFRAVAGIIILALLVRMVRFEEIVITLRGSNVLYVGCAFLLLFLNLFLQILKWRYLLKLANPLATWREASRSFIFGVTLGSITPAQLGEFAGRAWHNRDGDTAQTVGLTMIDKFQIMLVMTMTGIPAYLFLMFGGTWECLFLSLAVIGLSLYGLLLPAHLVGWLRRLNVNILRNKWTKSFLEPLETMRREQFSTTLALTLAFYGVLFFQMYFLLNAFSGVSLGSSFLGFSTMMVAKSLVPISVGDLGIREASAVYFFSLLGVPEATALSAAFGLFLMNILLPGFVGVFFFPRIRSAAVQRTSTPISLHDGK